MYTRIAKIHVQVLDLEAGAPLERAALSVLAARGVPSASAAWAQLIALALTLAKDRLSIDRSGLMTRLGQVLTVDRNAGPGAGAAAAVRSALEVISRPRLRSCCQRRGRTVLVQLPRFDENGDKCMQFQAGQVTLPSGEREVVRRAGSMTRMDGCCRQHRSWPARRSLS